MVKICKRRQEKEQQESLLWKGLDLFYIPFSSISLEVYSIKYNKATSQLEITYKSNSNMPAYFKGTIT
jgi:hypothetical protein